VARVQGALARFVQRSLNDDSIPSNAVSDNKRSIKANKKTTTRGNQRNSGKTESYGSIEIEGTKYGYCDKTGETVTYSVKASGDEVAEEVENTIRGLCSGQADIVWFR
jgi:hypothetical protein